MFVGEVPWKPLVKHQVLAIQFQGSNPKLGKVGRKEMKDVLGKAKCYEDVSHIVGELGSRCLRFPIY